MSYEMKTGTEKNERINSKVCRGKSVSLVINLISLASALLNVTVLVIIILLCYSKAIINNKISNDINDYFESDPIDYIVYGLTEEQSVDYLNNTFIDSVFLYYRYETTVSIDGLTKSDNVLFYSNVAENGEAPFSADRLLATTNNFNHSVALDYAYAKENGVWIGDKIIINLGGQKIDAQVNEIYENNYLDDGHIMIYYNNYMDILENLFDSFEYNYSYMQVNDSEQFIKYVNENYVPEVYMLTREDFTSEIDYQLYLREYYEKDYVNSDNISKISVLDTVSFDREVFKDKIITFSFLPVILLVINFVIAIFYAYIAKINKDSTNSSMRYTRNHIFSMVLSIILGVIAMIIFTLTIQSSTTNLNLSYKFVQMLVLFLIFVTTVVLSSIVKIFVTKKTYIK